MRYADVLQSIQYARTALGRSIQADLVSGHSNNEVSWLKYKPGISKNVYYPLEYQWLLDTRQYSFLLRNGSFLQFYYAFGDQGLYSARAALYPKPLLVRVEAEDVLMAAESAQDMEEHEFGEYLLNVVEEIEKKSIYPSNTSHIRFDFDRNVTTHSQSHVQFGGLNELRVEADFVPLPYAFIEAIADTFDGFEFEPDTAARAHSRNKALREISRGCLIHLTHAEIIGG